MPSKYDTNPLDPDFPEKARAAAAAEQETRALHYTSAETRHFYGNPVDAERTRRFAEPDVAAYSLTYNGQYVPANYVGAGLADMDRSSSRKVAKIGLPENIMTAVPYIPWYPGMVAALLMLILMPRSEAKVRFHAAQGLAAHAAIWIVSSILGGFAGITGVATGANGIFLVVTTVLLLIFAVKAWRGKPVHFAFLEDLTTWIEEKISPKN